MNDKQVRQAILVESHRYVDEYAASVVADIGAQRPPRDLRLVYPPTQGGLSAEEQRALRSMKLSEVERSALHKVIVDACGQMFFDFFNVIDGTTEPQVKPPRGVWVGARIVAPEEDSDSDSAMLHDDFFASRRDYEKKRTRGKRAPKPARK